jgi:acylphosphatase
MTRNQRRARVTVSGRVQGVFFRAKTQDVAVDLGLSGTVANLPDGRVEAVFQGPSHAVDQAIAFCRKGPPRAKVDAVEVVELDPVAEPAGAFEVR